MKKLQDFSFHKSHYERTSQKKICGWSIFGKACQIGPDKEGNCQAQYECVPYKKGDRWLCTRPGNSGGKCDQGPTAEGVCCNKTPRCVPIDSLRKRRGGLVLSVLILGIVSLIFFIATPLRSTLIDPGNLTTKHSLEGNQCVQCHVTDSNKVGEWFGNAFATVSVHQSNRKCLDCHDLGFYNATPHNLEPHKLSEITAHAPSDGVGSLRLFTPDGLDSTDKSKSKIACVSCHREHKGRDHDLTRMNNAQCSTCHVSSHKNFAKEHPQFTQYPHNRRQRIIFDHAAHMGDYFKEEKLKIFAPTTCASCHEVDNTGRYMQVKTFEQSCQSCHVKDVTGEKLEEKGFPVISLPALDLATLSANGVHVGQWPADLEDEEMTGVLLFLLSSEKKLHPILKLIDEGKVELVDLSGNDKKVLVHVQHLVWEIKRLIHELVSGGHEMLLKRIEQASGLPKTMITADLVGNMPLDMVLNAQQAWFPALNKEMSLYSRGKVPKTKGIATRSLKSSAITSEDWSKAGAWYAQDFSLYYRPGKHADEFIRSWLDITKSNAGSASLKLPAFNQLSYNKLPGQCSKCHSIDEVNDVTEIHWQGFRSNSEVHNFTDFNHKAHFSLLSEKGCATCHELDSDADFLSSYKKRDPDSFQSNWNNINKETCSTCHTPKAAGDDCTLCHNYHVGTFKVVLPSSSMGEKTNSK